MTSLSFHFATILTLVHLWSLRLTRSIRRTVKVLSSSRSTGRAMFRCMNQIQSLLYEAFSIVSWGRREINKIFCQKRLLSEKSATRMTWSTFSYDSLVNAATILKKKKGRKLRSRQPPKLCRMHPRLISK